MRIKAAGLSKTQLSWTRFDALRVGGQRDQTGGTGSTHRKFSRRSNGEHNAFEATLLCDFIFKPLLRNHNSLNPDRKFPDLAAETWEHAAKEGWANISSLKQVREVVEWHAVGDAQMRSANWNKQSPE